MKVKLNLDHETQWKKRDSVIFKNDLVLWLRVVSPLECLLVCVFDGMPRSSQGVSEWVMIQLMAVLSRRKVLSPTLPRWWSVL